MPGMGWDTNFAGGLERLVTDTEKTAARWYTRALDGFPFVAQPTPTEVSLHHHQRYREPPDLYQLLCQLEPRQQH